VTSLAEDYIRRLPRSEFHVKVRYLSVLNLKQPDHAVHNASMIAFLTAAFVLLRSLTRETASLPICS
jgi:hypothetical protein